MNMLHVMTKWLCVQGCERGERREVALRFLNHILREMEQVLTHMMMKTLLGYASMHLMESA